MKQTHFQPSVDGEKERWLELRGEEGVECLSGPRVDRQPECCPSTILCQCDFHLPLPLQPSRDSRVLVTQEAGMRRWRGAGKGRGRPWMLSWVGRLFSCSCPVCAHSNCQTLHSPWAGKKSVPSLQPQVCSPIMWQGRVWVEELEWFCHLWKYRVSSFTWHPIRKTKQGWH